jgi:hypothetical protein
VLAATQIALANTPVAFDPSYAARSICFNFAAVGFILAAIRG